MQVSIIIPTIGRPTLKLVLEALFKNKNFDQLSPEIIVAFDGDTSACHSEFSSASREILKPVQDDKRINFLETGQKAYAAGARNLGLQQAKGEVIAFVGDDTIPATDWLERLCQWHEDHPAVTDTLLGRVTWVGALARDPFHAWLEQTALFDYARLDHGLAPTWHHFYTSNVSVKRCLLQKNPQFSPRQGEREGVLQNTAPNLPQKRRSEIELFNEGFSGWGFEDSEFGYRLSQKGMQLHYDPQLMVHHDDPQTLEGLVKRTQQARINAKIFEQLHPEVKILPQHMKRLILMGVVIASTPLSFVPQINWWRAWKRAWLEETDQPIKSTTDQKK